MHVAQVGEHNTEEWYRVPMLQVTARAMLVSHARWRQRVVPRFAAAGSLGSPEV